MAWEEKMLEWIVLFFEVGLAMRKRKLYYYIWMEV